MKILVTGDTGLIGSHLVERLVQLGHEVFGVSTGKGPNLKLVEQLCTHTTLDLTDRIETKDYIVSVAPELVYHLAANAAESKGQFSPSDMTARNMGIAMNVIGGCVAAGAKRIVFTSSAAVYGTLHTPCKESDDPKPQDVYGVNKLAIEKCLRILSEVHGFEYVIARPHNVYGPQQNMSDKYRNVVTLFMNQLLRKERYSIYGDGSMQRCFSYVDDVVEVLEKMGYESVSGMTFNVGSDEVTSIKQLSDAIQKVASRDLPPQMLLDRPQDVHSTVVDHTLQKTLFGYKSTPLEEGLRHTWNWAAMMGAQEYISDDVEIQSKKLPENWKK